MNAILRGGNSSATRRDSTLVGLHSVVTGLPIDHHPSTVGEVVALRGKRGVIFLFFWFRTDDKLDLVADVDRLLVDLGLPCEGNLALKRRRLLLGLGVTTQAVEVDMY